MTEEFRRCPEAAPEDRLDRALDRMIAAEATVAPPPDLARRILAATAAIPQEPPPAAVRWTAWSRRPRAMAAAFALIAAIGFAAGWTEEMLVGDAQAVDVTPFLIGSDLEIDL